MLHRVVFVLLLATLTSGSVDSVRSGSFLWQGFNFQWQRSLIGFEVPHRIGSIANYIEQQAFSSANGTAELNVTFTPGVNGDYAYPSAQYSSVASTSDNGPKFVDDMAVFTFVDDASQTKNPLAKTSISRPITIDISGFSLNSSTSHFDAILRGFRMDLHCDPKIQPPGDVCNSNGMWPSKLWMEVSNCSSSSDSELTCMINLDVFRSWTPAHGGGKPFNYRLNFTAYIYLTVIGAPLESFHSTSDIYAIDSSVHSDISQGSLVIKPQVATKYASHRWGLQGWGVQLTETDNHPNLGRYMEQLQFRVSSAVYDPVSGEGSCDIRMGYLSPKTVYQSTDVLTVKPVLLQFNDVAAFGSKQKTVSGLICVTGPTFSCKDKHLRDSHNDVVPFST